MNGLVMKYQAILVDIPGNTGTNDGTDDGTDDGTNDGTDTNMLNSN